MIEGVGPRLRTLLLAKFGSPPAVFSADTDELQTITGIGPKVARAILAAEELDADAEIRLAWEHGVEVVTDQHDSYPPLLREIPDTPGVLYRQGTATDQDNLAIAIVGTRHATHYGLRQAERLAKELARSGFTIVSGLARGIDAAAHRAALAAGGRTIAVLASGLLRIYPPEHRELAGEVASSGWVVSEAPLQQEPFAGAFPQRNRIISGLTLGTIVIEAPLKSGALITARHAWEQNREVLAVPGPVESNASRGCHGLIRDGATLVETVEDVLDALGPLANQVERADGTTIRQPQEVVLNEMEQQVLQAIEISATSIDTVTEVSGLPVQRVLSTISVLEMRRLIRRVSGNQVARV